MALDIRIQSTVTVDVPDEVAADLLSTYEALLPLPSTSVAVVDFTEHETLEENVRAARRFVKQATTWATEQNLKFTRKGDISGQPDRVSFRIYEPQPVSETTAEGSPRKKPGRKPKNQEQAQPEGE